MENPWRPESLPTKMTKIDTMVEIIRTQPGIASESLRGLTGLSYSSLQSYHPELRAAGCNVVKNGRKGMKFYACERALKDDLSLY